MEEPTQPVDDGFIGTRVTAEDLENGEWESCVIRDNYVVICDGTCHIAGVQMYKNGSVRITIRGRKVQS